MARFSVDVYFSGAVEGVVDEAVARRLINFVGASVSTIYGRNGKNNLRERINGFNRAATHAPWFVLVDLDNEDQCAPPMRTIWLPQASRYMCFRIAVREIESWLIADRERLAQFLRVPISRVPRNPESLPDPKQTMVNLARQSRRASIAADMVPRSGSGRIIGAAYTSRLIEFVQDPTVGWRPRIAARSAPSLARSINRLRQLARTALRASASGPRVSRTP